MTSKDNSLVKSILNREEFLNLKSIYFSQLFKNHNNELENKTGILNEVVSITKYIETNYLEIDDSDLSLKAIPVDLNHLVNLLSSRGDSILSYSGYESLTREIFSKHSIFNCINRDSCQMRSLDLIQSATEIFSDNSKFNQDNIFLFGQVYEIKIFSVNKKESESYWVFKEAIDNGAKRFLFDNKYFDRENSANEPSDYEWSILVNVKQIVVLNSTISINSNIKSEEEFYLEILSSINSQNQSQTELIGLLLHNKEKLYYLNYLSFCSKCNLGIAKQFSTSNEQDLYGLQCKKKYKGYDFSEFLQLDTETLVKITPEEYQTSSSYLILKEFTKLTKNIIRNKKSELKKEDSLLLLILTKYLVESGSFFIFFLEIEKSILENENNIFLEIISKLEKKSSKVLLGESSGSYAISNLSTVYNFFNLNDWVLNIFLSTKESRIKGFEISANNKSLFCEECAGKGFKIKGKMYGKLFYESCNMCDSTGFLDQVLKLSSYETSFQSLFYKGFIEFLYFINAVPVGSVLVEHRYKKRIIEKLLERSSSSEELRSTLSNIRA